MRDQLVCTSCWKWFSGRTECPTCRGPLVDPETGQPVAAAAAADAHTASPVAGAVAFGTPPVVVGYPDGAQSPGAQHLQVSDYLARRGEAPTPLESAPGDRPAPVPPAAGWAPRAGAAAPDAGGAAGGPPVPVPPAAGWAPRSATRAAPAEVAAATGPAARPAAARTPVPPAPPSGAGGFDRAALPPAPPPPPPAAPPRPAALPPAPPTSPPLAAVAPGPAAAPASPSPRRDVPGAWSPELNGAGGARAAATPAAPPAETRAPAPSAWPLPAHAAGQPSAAPAAPRAAGMAAPGPPSPGDAAGGAGWGVRASSTSSAPPFNAGVTLHTQIGEAPAPVARAAAAVAADPAPGADPAATQAATQAATVVAAPAAAAAPAADEPPSRSGRRPRPTGDRRVLVGAAAALGSGVVVAALWVAASVATGLELAPLAVVVGAACGLAMRRWGRVGEPRAALSAVLAAVVAIGLGLVFSALAVSSQGINLGQLNSSFIPTLSKQTGTLGAALGVAGALLAGLAVVIGRGRAQADPPS